MKKKMQVCSIIKEIGPHILVKFEGRKLNDYRSFLAKYPLYIQHFDTMQQSIKNRKGNTPLWL